MRFYSKVCSTLMLIVLSFIVMGQGGVCSVQENLGGNGGSGQHAPTTLGGTVNTQDLTIPSGSTTTVTSDLVINATGKVIIEGDLIADTSKDGNVYGITINADGDVIIDGTIQAGSGSSGGTAKKLSTQMQPTDPWVIPTPDPPNPYGYFLWGEDGAPLHISAKGNLTIRSNSMLISGDGGNGIEGGGSIPGGTGGNGGNIVLCVGKKLTMRGSIVMGNGGNGGDITTTSEDGINLPSFVSGGGNSGFLYILADSYDWPGLNQSEISLDIIQYSMNTGGSISGGFGGHGGSITVIDDTLGCLSPPAVNGAISTQDQSNQDDAEHEDHKYAGSGGHGWRNGGNGGMIMVTSCMHTGYDGVDWTVIGGHGGDVKRLENNSLPCVGWPVVVFGAIGGHGGMAWCTSANGLMGDEAHIDGGKGGNATAFSGNGGNGEFFANHIGGNGGQALASGGIGGPGLVRSCNPLTHQPEDGPSGNGGNGGDGYAKGGKGGDGVTSGYGGEGMALGADPDEVACSGGDGGDGKIPGAGGKGGKVEYTEGSLGQEPQGELIKITAEVTHFGSAPDGSPGQVLTDADCQGWTPCDMDPSLCN
ncbi:MAG: hypothetical protein JSV03_10745 [Planctomycetota bacterium]|nr:MAG: hypothetical protein JSV03_10745 [Planctomycetota bacterium]